MKDTFQLRSTPSLPPSFPQDFCRRTISVPSVIPDDDDDFEDDDLVHPSKCFQFLVGSKSKHELMAVGGSWSPKEDGLNPDTDPKVLVNTAIRYGG